MSKLIKTTGGTFDPKESNIYFLASHVHILEEAKHAHNYLLVAINDIQSDGDLDTVEGWCDSGKKVFIDSGIFHLTQEHCRAHGTTMDQALALSPQEIDGFDQLLQRYLQVYQRLKDKCWGFIELDQGGRDRKIETRAMLHGHGVNPIPVYHPLNDGWDYFDYLAQRYDRICFGNVVQADRRTRQRLLATAWERHRRYPDLWIHLLGFTPNEWLYAMPINSGDSSSWLTSIRWSDSHRCFAMGKGFSHMPFNYRYQLGAPSDAPNGHNKAIAAAAYEKYIDFRSWRHYVAQMSTLGFEIYPEPR